MGYPLRYIKERTVMFLWPMPGPYVRHRTGCSCSRSRSKNRNWRVLARTQEITKNDRKVIKMVEKCVYADRYVALICGAADLVWKPKRNMDNWRWTVCDGLWDDSGVTRGGSECTASWMVCQQIRNLPQRPNQMPSVVWDRPILV